MDLVKKWLSCIISFVAGVLGLSLSATSGMKTIVNDKVVDKTKAFKVITDSKLADQAELYQASTEFTWLKIFAIITLIVSVLLIIYAIILLLKNLDIIKSSSSLFGTTGILLASLLLISAIGLMITSNIYANAVQDFVVKLNPLFSMKLGAYQPLILVISIITFIAIMTDWYFNRKRA